MNARFACVLLAVGLATLAGCSAATPDEAKGSTASAERVVGFQFFNPLRGVSQTISIVASSDAQPFSVPQDCAQRRSLPQYTCTEQDSHMRDPRSLKGTGRVTSSIVNAKIDMTLEIMDACDGRTWIPAAAPVSGSGEQTASVEQHSSGTYQDCGQSSAHDYAARVRWNVYDYTPAGALYVVAQGADLCSSGSCRQEHRYVYVPSADPSPRAAEGDAP